jgi:hypothetical protein
MPDEIPMLVLSSSDRIMSRGIGEEGTPLTDRWELSSPIPGMRIINTWQIYNKIWLVLTLAENGNYNIFQSINLQNYVLVHSHGAKIYGLYYVDDGHVIFCAEDGWWRTTDAGTSWQAFSWWCSGYLMLLWMTGMIPAGISPSVEALPCARSTVIVAIRSGLWKIVAYAEDRKIYCADYPGGVFEAVYDAADSTEKWYPAIAGGPIGILAGAGSKLLRSDAPGDSFYEIQTVNGIIKSIAISNQSNLPIFLISIEQADGQAEKLYWTFDLGDSLVPYIGRIGAAASIQAVTPTGSGEVQTTFAVLGQRTAEGPETVKVVEGAT